MPPRYTAIYARVSSEQQTNEKTIPSQIAGAGVLRICQARDPGDTGDQRLPGRVQLASGVEDLNAAMLLAAMPAAVHSLVAVEAGALGAKPGQGRMQGGLVLLDPDQQGIAGRGGLCKPILL